MAKIRRNEPLGATIAHLTRFLVASGVKPPAAKDRATVAAVTARCDARGIRVHDDDHEMRVELSAPDGFEFATMGFGGMTVSMSYRCPTITRADAMIEAWDAASSGLVSS